MVLNYELEESCLSTKTILICYECGKSDMFCLFLLEFDVFLFGFWTWYKI